jgi:peroxiredoxin
MLTQGQAAPDFTLKTDSGEDVTLSAQGEKPLSDPGHQVASQFGVWGPKK